MKFSVKLSPDFTKIFMSRKLREIWAVITTLDSAQCSDVHEELWYEGNVHGFF